MRVLLVLAGLAGLVLFGVFVLGAGPAAAPSSARALEASLLAPCCFGGTLDVHDSDISRELRSEIEQRVARGESTTAVQDDLVQRYGPQMLAMPHAGAFSATMSTVMIAIVLGGAALLFTMRRWRADPSTAERASSERASAVAPSGGVARGAEDERLDAELEAFE